jgi:hypothetical protein
MSMRAYIRNERGDFVARNHKHKRSNGFLSQHEITNTNGFKIGFSADYVPTPLKYGCPVQCHGLVIWILGIYVG